MTAASINSTTPVFPWAVEVRGLGVCGCAGGRSFSLTYDHHYDPYEHPDTAVVLTALEASERIPTSEGTIRAQLYRLGAGQQRDEADEAREG
jgi:hypothetical protein